MIDRLGPGSARRLPLKVPVTAGAGSVLMRTGVEVTLPLPDSSELVLLQAL